MANQINDWLLRESGRITPNINQKMMKLEWMYKIIEMIGLEDQVDISASSAL